MCVRKRAVNECGVDDNNVNEDKDRKMKTKKKVSLLDFYREEGRQLDLMNTFMARFHKGDIIYVCGMSKGHIPHMKMMRYEVDRTVPAKYRIRRHLFRKPEFIVLQKPEFWARGLGGREESLSSVNNHRVQEYAEGKEAYDQILFWEGSADVILGELSVRSEMVLEVFGSTAHLTRNELFRQFETYEEFESRYIDKLGLIESRPCVARITPEPVLVFSF